MLNCAPNKMTPYWAVQFLRKTRAKVKNDRVESGQNQPPILGPEDVLHTIHHVVTGPSTHAYAHHPHDPQQLQLRYAQFPHSLIKLLPKYI